MDLLLDTHAFLWWVAGDEALSFRARAAIGDEGNAVFVSAASAWEIATKVRIGKLPGAAWIAQDLAGVLRAQGFSALGVGFEHGAAAGALGGVHRDPFDRMLIAQAMAEGMALVSNEQRFDVYGVRRVW